MCKTRKELIAVCKERGLKGYSTKTKAQLVELLGTETTTSISPTILDEVIIHPDAKFKFIDLFCGIGGFHQALTQLGGQCVFASDIDANCRDTYTDNYGIRPHGDITQFRYFNGWIPLSKFLQFRKKRRF